MTNAVERSSTQRSFEGFVADRETALLRTAVFLAGGREAGQDLLQDALLRTYRHWRRIDDPDSYVRRALVNGATSRWRRRRFREEPIGPAAEHAGYAVQGDSERVPERDALLTALRSLPPQQRAVLVLRYFDDLTEAQTAALLGCSPGTVKTHAHRGLRRMRAVLALDELGEFDESTSLTEGGAR